MNLRREMTCAVSCVLIALGCASPANAWKPNTHLYAGDVAYADATDGDGAITVHGHNYPLPHLVVQALSATGPGGAPRGLAYYHLGVIGPDGTPDLIYGQSIIHPGAAGSPGHPYPYFINGTGVWMRYIYDAAWAAQIDPAYSSADRQNILAYAYGYLIHAAQDMWAHTFVNGFAGGVFPAFSDLTSGPGPVPERVFNATENVLRHIIVEGYVGQATPGTDHNTDEAAPVCPDGQAPNIATSCLDRGQPDYSDNTTPGVVLPTPSEIANTGFEHWMYRWFISDSATTPGHNQSRGLLLDLFIKLRRTLDRQTHKPSATAKALRDAFDHARSDLDDIRQACRNWYTSIPNAARCAFAIGLAPFKLTASVVADAIDVAKGVVADAENAVLNLYRYRWIADIDDGLRHWPEFGLATTRALFDPQIRRDVQNDACFGTEGTPGRNACEEGFGPLTVLKKSTEVHAFIHNTDYGLLVMAGAPDLVVGVGNFLDGISDAAKDALRALGPFNPLVVKDAVEEAVKSAIEDYIKDSLQIDIPGFENFYRHPSRWVCADVSQSLTIPRLGTLTAQEVFPPGTQARLEALMGLSPDVSVTHEQVAGLPLACGPLKEDVAVDPATFRALGDTVTMTKLALLSGGSLNKVFGDELTDEGIIKSPRGVVTYDENADPATGAPRANVMVDGLNFRKNYAADPKDPYLRLIDGDHAWRQDGLPRFCSPPTPPVPRPVPPRARAGAGAGAAANCPAGATLREARLNGGTGSFPPFDSCLMRPSFSHLFANWENGDSPEFQALGDDTSPDISASLAPEGLLAISRGYSTADRTFIGADGAFSLRAESNLFTTAHLGLHSRIYEEGTESPAWTARDAGVVFGLPPGATDGLWHVGYGATDDICHPAVGDGGPDTGARHTKDVVLDTAAPSSRSPPPTRRTSRPISSPSCTPAATMATDPAWPSSPRRSTTPRSATGTASTLSCLAPARTHRRAERPITSATRRPRPSPSPCTPPSPA